MQYPTKINLGRIDFEDRRYCFTLSKAEGRFLHSVKQVGIVQPIMVIERSGKQVVVSGWRRIEAAKICGLKELPALEIKEALSDLEVMKVTFFDNYGQRRFSIAEKALAVKRLSDFGLSSEEIIARILPLLELPPERPTLDILLKLSKLPVGLEKIHQKDWKLSTVELFLNFPDQEQLWLLRLIENLTHNQQKEAIELFYCLKKRKKKSLRELLEKPGLESYQKAFKNNRLLADDQLLSILRKEAYPQMFRLNELIGQTIKQLRLPEKVSLDYDRTLEKTHLKLMAEVRSVFELETYLNQLVKSFNDENWAKLFDILNNQGQ
ncbi:MAG: ParB N-terminal domain-containing protein [Candidatus Saccharicenans sp.]|nr:ParB N-terminal domain-containing protein [Candidatus Saccharicenans sp.]